MKALFDTNIVIDYLSGVEAARKEMERYSDWSISIVTWMEVMVAAAPEQENKTRAFLASFVNFSITAEVAERAVVLRKRRKFKAPDAIILATAEISGRLLITRNNKDFFRGDPGVRIPYKI